MSADLTPQEAKKMGDADLVSHMNTYRGDSGVWHVAFNELNTRHKKRLALWSAVVSGVVSVAINTLAKFLGI